MVQPRLLRRRRDVQPEADDARLPSVTDAPTDNEERSAMMMWFASDWQRERKGERERGRETMEEKTQRVSASVWCSNRSAGGLG